MNRTQKLNRPKRIRLTLEASRSAAHTANHKPSIAKQAADKTPVAQRTGNYYVKVKQGVRKQCTNIKPYYKVNKPAKKPNVFANILDAIKEKFGF